MTEPEIKPRNDFTPATNRTAFQHADTLANGIYDATIKLGCNHEAGVFYRDRAFQLAINGAALLQNFMNSIDKGKS